jgi:hypothetical protein
VFYAFIAALLMGWRPPSRLFNTSLSLPLVSVAAIAWASGNPFNGTVISIAAILVFVSGWRSTGQTIAISEPVFAWPGSLLVAFGLLYPHFVSGSPWTYLTESPVGLLPCPTLSLISGLALIAVPPGQRTHVWTLMAVGLFYGVFGVLKLGVYIDGFLVLGAMLLFRKEWGHQKKAL